jgi:hypothetical protein
METSTLVLTALATLNGELLNDDAFAGYSGEHDEVQRLLTELYDLIYAHGDPLPTVTLLVEAWYDQFYSEHPDLLCDG